MIKTKKTLKEVEEVVDVVCNKCGESCKPKDIPADSPEFYGLINLTVSGGYHSTHLEDMTSVNFSVCEGCLSDFIKTFKHPPLKTDY